MEDDSARIDNTNQEEDEEADSDSDSTINSESSEEETDFRSAARPGCYQQTVTVKIFLSNGEETSSVVCTISTTSNPTGKETKQRLLSIGSITTPTGMHHFFCQDLAKRKRRNNRDNGVHRYLKNGPFGFPFCRREGGPTFWLFEWIVFICFVIERKRLRVRLGISQNDTVLDLKKKIDDRKGVGVGKFVLIHKGQALKDPFTLKEYNVRNGATIYAIMFPVGHERTTVVGASRKVQDHHECPGNNIVPTEHRGITLAQLINVAFHILLLCEAEQWTSTNPTKYGQVLKPEEVTLYDLVEHYIKPITREHQCSYVEFLISKEKQQQEEEEDHNAGYRKTVDHQTPKWFVSHWWGEPVFDMVSCLQCHAYHKHLGYHAPYWICAYAINQHNVTGELGSTPQTSPFYKAMKLTKGAVSVLDRNCVCYSRIWCSFEVATALGNWTLDPNTRYEYTVYTLTQKGLSVGLQDGAFDRLQKQQRLFPTESSIQALGAQIETAEASRPEDRRLILNSICGYSNDTDQKPPSSHPKYDEFNALLHGKIAMCSYRQALEGARVDMTPFRTALSNAPLTLAYGYSDGCNRFRLEAPHFLRSLPPTLGVLFLDFYNIGFETSEEFAIGIGQLPSGLTTLYLTLRHRGWHQTRPDTSLSLCCATALWHGLENLKQLTRLHIDMLHNQKMASLRGLADSLVGMTALETLSLNFMRCQSLPDEDIIHLCKQLESLPLFESMDFQLHFGSACLKFASPAGNRDMQIVYGPGLGGRFCHRVQSGQYHKALKKGRRFSLQQERRPDCVLL